MCYLAINGGEFLQFADNLLNKNVGGGVTEADLPVDGNANRVIDIKKECKPLWWYVGLFPLWCKIATVGQANMTERLSEEGDVNDTQSSSPSPQNVNEEVLIPNGREFCIAILFIIFGVISVIAGVGSNLYAQIVIKEEVEE